MDPIVQQKRVRSKDEDEHPLVAGLKDLMSKGPVKRRGDLIPDATLKKVHFQRIRQAMKRCAPDEWTEEKNPSEQSRLKEEYLVRALSRNLKDLSRRGVEMTMAQYRTSLGL